MYCYFKRLKADFSYFLLIGLLGAALRGVAQSPGYMGKHISFGYGAYASPGAISSNEYTVINFLHEGFLECAVSKKASLGLSLRYYSTAINNEGEVRGTYPVNGSYYAINAEPRGITEVKGLNYAAYAKLFKKRYLAPWGKYFILGATLNTYVASYDPGNMYVPYIDPDGRQVRFSDFGPGRQSYVKFDVFFGNGRSRIITNRIILDYGYNINIWAATTLIDDLLEGEGKPVSADEYIKKMSSKRVRGVNRFHVFLKIGVLLF